MYIIEVNNLTVNYGLLTALEEINFKIKEKEFLGIIGPNGGGKTTLIKAILGLKEISSGNIIINSEKAIGYVPQFSSFDKKFPISVFDVVLMGRLSGKLKFFKKYSKEEKKYAENIMEKLGIIDLRNRQIGQLSGGQLQKVLIARALITNPDILILDEPTASIDSNTKIDIYNILKKLNYEKTIIIVSHDMEDIFKYVDSILCVNKKAHYHGNNYKISKNKNINGCPIDIFFREEKEVK